MSEAREQEQVQGTGTAAGGRPTTRDALIEAAFRLFLEHGFEQTTIDEITALAGVGRRSFFRYFPSKEDVVFPDHEGALAEMTSFLDAAPDSGDPVVQVCDAARLVLRMYAANPTFSVERYLLTRKVPNLRIHELSVVWRYERTLAAHLRARYSARSDGALRADVVAAAVVAAHNHALRTWLRTGGAGNVREAVDLALEFVIGTWSEQAGTAPGDGAGPAEDVVVLVARRGTPMWRVVQGIESALDG
ncbi:TetR family transcriptional regulator [Kitasatospora sp. NPDC048540]|uniref:TetR family transcriptional regulator n=1 Tax=unclassified Kitasatospora TaxID=2633591 RepID=UPI000539FCBE|nr:TetR family transcriptional regulator [Kitasatospora sp. MBT63]